MKMTQKQIELAIRKCYDAIEKQRTKIDRLKEKLLPFLTNAYEIQKDIPSGRYIYKPKGGSHLLDVCKEACILSKRETALVEVVFSGTRVLVSPTDTCKEVSSRWQKKREMQK